MDDPTVLLGILSDLKKNIEISFYLSTSGRIKSSLNEDFYTLVHGPGIPIAAEDVGTKTVMSGVRQTFVQFTDIVSHKIRNREQVFASFSPNLSNIVHQKAACCDRICKLREEMEEVERLWENERNARLDVIKHVEFRIDRVKEKTVEALRLARECGEAANKELLKNSEQPIEERRLNVNMYQSRFTTLCRENGVVEDQLEKCRMNLDNEIDALTTKLQNDTDSRNGQLEDLSRQMRDIADELQRTQEELVEITGAYDEIMEKRRKEEEEKKRLQEIKIKRERAAIRIQRWYRFHKFRKMGRRRRKKGKHHAKHPSSSLKFQVQTTSKEEVRKAAHKKGDVEVSETGTASPVMSTVSSSNMPSPLPDEKSKNKPSKTNRRSVTSPIKQITVQAATGTIKEENEEDLLTDLPGTLSRGAQTDGRVPKSKLLYRQKSQY